MNKERKEDMDVDKWLKSNNLTKLKPLFEDNDLIIEELCEFDDEQLTAFIAEQQEIYKNQRYFDVLTQHRFKKAIKNTKQTINNENPSNNLIHTNININNKPQNNNNHLIVTPQEHEAINKLYNHYDNICKLKDSIQENAFKQLEQCSNKLCETDIELQFNQIINIINKNKQKLLNNINEMVNNKTNAIHKQLETIKQYQTQVDSKRQEFENMIYNYQQTNAPFKDINLSQRNQYIIKQTYKILHSNNAQMAIVTQPNIKFELQTEQMKQFLNEEFILNSCDQPVPAAFTIIKIGFCFVQVSFNWQNKNVNEYEISVGLKKKLPKHKDENENKKKRKAAKIQSAFTNNSFTFGTNNNSNNNFSWNFGNQNNPFSNAQNAFSFPQNDVSPFKFGIDNKKEKKYEIFAKEQIKTEMIKAENNNDIDMKCDNEKEGLKHENIENIKWKSERYNASKYNNYNKYVTIYDLKSECEYLICIRGINACGWGNYSKYLSFTTKREPKCKKIDLEIIECRGYYRRSSNGQYYHPIHLLRDITNKSYNNKYDFDFDAPIDELDEEYMYASDRGYTFEENEYDWIIFKPKKSKHRRYYITQIIIFGAGDTYMPKTFKIEIGDKKSLKLQKPVIDPEIHRKMKMKSSVKMKCAMPTYAATMKIYKNKKSKKKKKLKKMKIKKKLKSKSKYVKQEELSSSESCDSEYVSSEDTSSDEKSSDSEYDKNKKDNCSKNKDREWIIMKPKVLETQLRYGRQVFNVKPKFISDRRCNYIKVSFMTSHNPNQMVKGNKFRLSRLEIWGIAIKD